LDFIKNHTKDILSETIMKIASDIASGMSAMNSLGIVHRDLKSFSFFPFFHFSRKKSQNEKFKIK